MPQPRAFPPPRPGSGLRPPNEPPEDPGKGDSRRWKEVQGIRPTGVDAGERPVKVGLNPRRDCPAPCRVSTVRALPSQPRERCPQRRIGDPDQSLEGPVQLENQ